MSLPFQRRKIHCPKCDYEGDSKKVIIPWPPILFLLFLIGAWAVPLLWIGAIVFLLYFLFFGSKDICPECNCENATPLELWRATNPPAPPEDNQ